MKNFFAVLLLIAGFSASAQIKIGANPTALNGGSLLELESSTKGLKFPEVALTSTTLWAPLTGTKVMGMTVYNTATGVDVTPGLYTNNGTSWVKNEAAASTIPTWRSDNAANVLILASDGNNFVQTTNTNITGVIFPSPTNSMKGKIFTVFETTASSFANAAITMTGTTVYNTPTVTQIVIGTGYQFVTDGFGWFCISGQ